MRPKPIVAHRRHKNTAMMSKEPKSNAEVMKGAIPHFGGIHCATTHPIGNNLDKRQEDGRSDQKNAIDH